MSINQIFKKVSLLFLKKDVWLIPIIVLGIFLSFYPHLDYSFLFHIDEWFHIAQAKQIVLGSEVNWYTGEPFLLGMERAWHGLLAGIYFLFRPTSKQWIFLPSILHVLAILSTYVFVSKFFDKTKGLVSSFLIALLPTNNTIGGPVFLIPVNLSLIIIPFSLLFAFNLVKINRLYKYVILVILISFLLYAHAPSAIVLLMIITVKSFLLLFSKKKDERTEALYLFTVMFTSIVLSLPNFLNEMYSRGLESITFNFFIKLNEIFLLYGILPTMFFIIGFYFASKSKSKEIWALLLTSLFLLVNIVVFARLEVNILLPYQRTFVPLFLFMAIIGSIGFTKVLEITKQQKRIGFVLFIVLLMITGIVAVNSNLSYSYYRIIDETDFENGGWIRENTDIDDVLICDPWKARALAPIAERQVYAVTPFGPVEDELKIVKRAKSFLNDDCRNTSFLIEYNISIVYARGYNVYNPDLIELKEDVYIIKQNATFL